jgi:DNA-binding transcriptional ArsR family regulator
VISAVRAMAVSESRHRRGGGDVDVRVVKALAHPTRVRILHILRDRELASPVELAGELGLPLGTVGYHVRRLEVLGFIELAKRTQRRGAVEHHYRARSALDLPAEPGPAPSRARRGKRATAALAAVGEAQEALARGGFDGVVALAESRRLTLDASGSRHLDAALQEWEATVERIARACAHRRGAAGGCTLVAMRFEAPADDLVS